MAQALETQALEGATLRGGAPGDEPSTRARIIATAERFFREIGYRKTTVADIAGALRMSPANVYRFFDSKKAINEAVAERLMDELHAAIIEAAGRAGRRPSERLRDVLATIHRMNTDRFTANRRMHEMVEVAMTESWPLVAHHIERVDDVLRGVIEAGVAAGEFAVADPLVAARCVHAASVRFCHPTLIVQCADLAGPSLDEMLDFVLAGLRGPGASPPRARAGQ